LSEEDRKRIDQIRAFRDLGVPLRGVRSLREARRDTLTPVLLWRLVAINSQTEELRGQQLSILALIELCDTSFLGQVLPEGRTCDLHGRGDPSVCEKKLLTRLLLHS
jgi:DNA-binding transcriptional MerR regulator